MFDCIQNEIVKVKRNALLLQEIPKKSLGISARISFPYS